ncbi:hypothetical protein V7094_29010 [Priestia megaterium]|uniref:hypothetical protein n=1 Tax=Priestia megaterium TaxID=1404 RepID=UPI0030005DF2
MLTLTALNECFKDAIEKGSQFIAVKINVGLNQSEIIINPRANFEEKRAYYNHAYDEMLHHRFAGDTDIRITGFTHGYSFSEIETQLSFQREDSFRMFLN